VTGEKGKIICAAVVEALVEWIEEFRARQGRVDMH
jgi:creatinine amidohydrolase/Fe(II)-dependent formamide hydrolase-like protein